VWFTCVTFNLYEWDNKTFLNYLWKTQGSDSKWSKQDPDEHRYILVS
jgi:hypothetical protein